MIMAPLNEQNISYSQWCSCWSHNTQIIHKWRLNFITFRIERNCKYGIYCVTYKAVEATRNGCSCDSGNKNAKFRQSTVAKRPRWEISREWTLANKIPCQILRLFLFTSMRPYFSSRTLRDNPSHQRLTSMLQWIYVIFWSVFIV